MITGLVIRGDHDCFFKNKLVTENLPAPPHHSENTVRPTLRKLKCLKRTLRISFAESFHTGDRRRVKDSKSGKKNYRFGSFESQSESMRIASDKKC